MKHGAQGAGQNMTEFVGKGSGAAKANYCCWSRGDGRKGQCRSMPSKSLGVCCRMDEGLADLDGVELQEEPPF